MMAIAQFKGKNVLKVNLGSLVFGNYHVTYERGLSRKVSLSISYRHMPVGGLIYKEEIKKYIDNNDPNVINTIEQTTTGNFAITPELRFYTGAGRMRGLYVAPYFRYAKFDASVPARYNSTVAGVRIEKNAIMQGNIQSYSGGILIGVQRYIAKRIAVDIWLIGGHYGISTGLMVASIDPPMTTAEQQSLQNTLNGLATDPFKTQTTITATSASMKIDGPWGGIRSGISLGFRF
jgi:hypothetical protein